MPEIRIVDHRGRIVWRSAGLGGYGVLHAEIPPEYLGPGYERIIFDDYGTIIPPPPPTPEKESVMPRATPVSTVPAEITTLDEAKQAFADFQDRLYQEASERGYLNSFTEFVNAAAREIPQVELDAPANPGTATLSVTLTIPVEIPANPAQDGTTGRNHLRDAYKQWGRENGYDGTQIGNWTEALARFLFAHPERVRFNRISANIEPYTYRSDQPATPPRLRFVGAEKSDEKVKPAVD